MRKTFGISILLISLFPAVLFLSRCAQPVAPGGGPKDKEPPKVLKYEPDNFSTHFSSDRFKMEFDEFVELDNINQKVLISPPMDKMPDFKVKGKSLVVKFNEELKENTTYTIYLGDAVVDITEKNPLKANTYIFSTGDKVDSMSMDGTVVQAIDLKPAEDVFVMLYKINNDTLPLDSLPLVAKPFYLSKTDKNGKFRFNGLADEQYLIFALRDLNSNHIFDQPTEEIAFLDTLVIPFFTGKPKTTETDTTVADTLAVDSLNMLIDSLRSFVADTLLADSLTTLADSTLQDSLKQAGEKEYHSVSYKLYLFKNRDSTQRLLKAELIRRNTLEFDFSLPATKVKLIPVNYTSDSLWYLEEFSKKGDTIRWYLKNIPVDTLELNVMNGADTLEYLYLNLKYGAKSARSRVAKKDEKKKKIYLEWTSNAKGGTLKPNRLPKIKFEQPLRWFSTDMGSLIIGEDTTYRPKAVITDSFRMHLTFPIKLKEETKYSYYFPDSSFVDWNGYFNREIRLSFETKTKADYGKMTMILQPETDQPYVFQMTDEKGNVLREACFHSDTTLSYDYLKPAKYKFRVVFDDNGNRQWDTGYYRDKIQPERILFYNKDIEVRANWEVEETWKIK